MEKLTEQLPEEPDEDGALRALLRRLAWLIPFCILMSLPVLYFTGDLQLPPRLKPPFERSQAPSSHQQDADREHGEQLEHYINSNPWIHIEPSTTLKYYRCHDDFECARLSVPLNWNASVEEQGQQVRASIAVIKLPAKVSVTDPRHGGPLIVNPGGPGESGIRQVLSQGRAIRTIVDHRLPVDDSVNITEARYFDIVSFDPRGVNNTEPKLQCFPDMLKQNEWLRSNTDFGLLWDSKAILGTEWARATALGQSCSQDSLILRYANTAQVVQDVVLIIEEEARLKSAMNFDALPCLAGVSDGVEFAIYDKIRYRPGQAKLQYWGVSYGTLLGTTFAAMHPDRVGRVLLDGVMDPTDYYSGTWLKSLIDSDMVLTGLATYCFVAGPEECPLHTGAQPNDVLARLTSALIGLKSDPMPVSSVKPWTEDWHGPHCGTSAVIESMWPIYDRDASNIGPDLITYGDVHLYLLSALYFPLAMAPLFFEIIEAVESRNSSHPKLIELINRRNERLRCGDGCQHRGSPIPYVSMLGHTQSIGCMDSWKELHRLNKTGFCAHLEELQEQSTWVSPSWARNKLQCLGHDLGPVWQPNLAFNVDTRYKTAHPILLIGNQYDPATPRLNAQFVSSLFESSVVLSQQSEGHGSMAMPSLETAAYIRGYFQTGVLPHPGTYVRPEYRPFIGCERVGGCEFDEASQLVWDALMELADPFSLAKNGEANEEHLQRTLLSFT